MDIIGCLPPEISQLVLLHLGSEDIEVVSNGIEEWKHLFDNYFWEKVCRRNDYQENEGNLSSDLYNECMLKYSLRWQAIYMYNRLIESNWLSGNYKCISISNKIMYDKIHYFDDEILIASVYIRTTRFVSINIINLSTGNIFLSFDEHHLIENIMKHQNLLIYFVYNRLKVLNLETKSWNLALDLEISKISSSGIHLGGYNKLISVLNPSDVFYIVNLETKNITFKTLDVIEACFGDNIVIVALKNSAKLIKVFDLNGKPLMDITYGGRLRVSNISLKNGYVIIYYSASAGQRIKKVSYCTIHQETKSLQEIASINMDWHMACFPNQYTMLLWIWTRSRNNTCKIWRFVTENRYEAFNIDGMDLVCAFANNRYLFLYTEDRALKILCLKTGKFIKDITKDDMVRYLHKSFQVTNKKFAYINSHYHLCVHDYDIIAK